MSQIETRMLFRHSTNCGSYNSLFNYHANFELLEHSLLYCLAKTASALPTRLTPSLCGLTAHRPTDPLPQPALSQTR